MKTQDASVDTATQPQDSVEEGYNSKLGNKLKQHPNFYAFCGELKNELEASQLDTLAAKTGNKNIKKKKEKKHLSLKKFVVI